MCSTQRCPNRSTKSGQCSMCYAKGSKERDAKRPSSYARGWTAKWIKFRAQYLKEHPRCECEQCSKLPVWQRPVATEIDHIDGSGRTGHRAYEESNLMAMSHACHSRKTALHDGAFGRKVSRKASG